MTMNVVNSGYHATKGESMYRSPSFVPIVTKFTLSFFINAISSIVIIIIKGLYPIKASFYSRITLIYWQGKDLIIINFKKSAIAIIDNLRAFFLKKKKKEN